MKNIIVPIDFSDHSIIALEKALYLAERIIGEITLVHVKETQFLGSVFGSGSKRVMDDNIEGNFDTLRKKYEKDFQVEVREGTIYREIVDVVEEKNAFMVVMGTHGMSGFEELWIGSNAYKVVSSVECPVITLREKEEDHSIKKILMPIDSSIHSRHKIPFTMQLAQYFHAEINVLAVSTENDGETKMKVSRYAIQVKDFLDEHSVATTLDEKFGGNITENTLEYASKIDADLISIMTEQEISTSNLLLGPYAQQMVNHSSKPVLSIHPNPEAFGRLTY